jgi:uroporphyrinogen III methyltransferase/synthase
VPSGRLAGKRIVILRPKGQAEETAQAVRERGGDPVSIPIGEIGPPEDPAPFDQALSDLDGYDVVAFTSANGVRCAFDRLAVLGRDAGALGRVRVAAVGPATAKALAKRGVDAAIVAEEHRSEGLADAILGALGRRPGRVLGRPGGRVLVLRARVARDALPVALQEAGLTVDVVAAYEKKPAGAAELAALGAELAAGRVDALLLTSSSAAEQIAAVIGPDPLRKTLVASIGPVTTETATRLGIRVDLTASPHTMDALLDLLEKTFG